VAAIEVLEDAADIREEDKEILPSTFDVLR
jgi:hypothetical protein